jgi:CubicO group peptidase (beta-lactamase class C family)
MNFRRNTVAETEGLLAHPSTRILVDGAYSVSKGASHLIVALLVQEGVLDLDQRDSHYWPEFAAKGKQDITLRELLSHRAGLVGADTGFSLKELADDRVVAERLGAQRLYWRPVSAFGYHALVMAALSNEVVCRATGRTIQELFGEQVRDPYEVDFYLGLPEDEETRFLDPQPALSTPERLAGRTFAERPRQRRYFTAKIS